MTNININIELDEDDTDGVAEAVRNIADMIDRGFTSGYSPAWNVVTN